MNICRRLCDWPYTSFDHIRCRSFFVRWISLGSLIHCLLFALPRSLSLSLSLLSLAVAARTPNLWSQNSLIRFVFLYNINIIIIQLGQRFDITAKFVMCGGVLQYKMLWSNFNDAIESNYPGDQAMQFTCLKRWVFEWDERFINTLNT